MTKDHVVAGSREISRLPEFTFRRWFKNARKKAYPFLMISPALFLLSAALVYPLGYSFWLSFHNWSLITFRKGVPFVGLSNYIQVFSDSQFWTSLGVTYRFMIGAISLEFILGMGIALLLNQNIRNRKLFRSLVLVPMMATNIVIGLAWRMMYNYDAGIINWFLGLFGIPPVTWLSDIHHALLSLVLVDVWNSTSFVALLLLAGLQSMPDEPVEAARIDGASFWQVFIYIFLPLLRPTILVILVWRVIDTFKVFDVVFTLTGGGPGTATETISLFAYYNGFQRFDLGYASAISYTMMFIMLGMAAVLFRLISRTEQIF
jgi:multiple sugar transport system permease protein